MIVSFDRLNAAYQTALAALLAQRTPEGYWEGELSTSALSTATAVCALALVDRAGQTSKHAALIERGLAWLAEHQLDDGGWGDTIRSISNISTTMLCRAAFPIAGQAEKYAGPLRRAEQLLQGRYGKTAPEQAEAVRARYGKDRTFAVPILVTSALAGQVSWKEVAPLPFELACLPMSWFPLLRLPVVSYALPALIAVGQAVFHHRPSWNPIIWIIRKLARGSSLDVLEEIQPSSGGFLEAVPLTSFVTLSLASIGQHEHPVVRKAVKFLAATLRTDGSWPIDSNLATWVTTQAVNALSAAGELPGLERRGRVRSFLTRQQFTERHPYTGAEPGGWGWTDLPGSVPDADDTAGALLALSHLLDFIEDREPNPSPRALARCTVEERSPDQATKLPRLPDLAWEARVPILQGLTWLRKLQNADGGWPTFCRGWGSLPFDRSGTDLTAHVLRAFAAWKSQIDADQAYIQALTGAGQWGAQPGFPLPVIDDELAQGLAYLEKHQQPDGSWVPLWFGNQYAPDDHNPTYGTARVLAAYRDLDKMKDEPARKGVAWLLASQNPDGGWGGARGTPSSLEETALAVEILLDCGPEALKAADRGLTWLVDQVEKGGLENPTPIGFYFAKLWYFERLYPIIFAVAALGRARLKSSGG